MTGDMAIQIGGRVGLRRDEVQGWRGQAHARRNIRRRQMRAAKRAAPPLALLAVLQTGSVAWIAWAGDPEPTWFAAGANVAAWIALAAWAVFVMSGTDRRTTGLDAQEWTRSEVRKLRRQGWRAVHGVPLPNGGDIDHVIVGPAGAFAVETKWSLEWAAGRHADDTLRRAAAQAKAGRRKVALILRSSDRGGRIDVPVEPLIVVWGRLPDGTPTTAEVPVVHGSDLQSWLEDQADRNLDEAAVARAVEKIEALADVWEAGERERDERTGAVAPVLIELGPLEVLTRIGLGLLGGLGGVVGVTTVMGLLSDALGPRLRDLAAVFSLAGVGVALRRGRRPRVRVIGAGVLATVGFFAALALWSAALHLLQLL